MISVIRSSLDRLMSCPPELTPPRRRALVAVNGPLSHGTNAPQFALPEYPGVPLPATPAELDNVVRVMDVSAKYARSLGLQLGIEPVNRYGISSRPPFLGCS
jgi:hypothetical protein